MSELHILSPAGFQAAGVYSQIKRRKTNDVGLLIADAPATAAAVFTTNKVFAAPVLIGRKHVAAGKLRGVVLNSGNANACTGKQGERDAMTMCQLASDIAGCAPREILPSSTGIIGHLLPMNKITAGIAAAGATLGKSAEHAAAFTESILTTDTRKKIAATRIKIGGQTVTLAGICKGAGMIGPRMALPQATMLAYLTTDAQIAAPLLRKLLKQAADLSFNAVTIDDHTSTNDTAVVLASGASGAKIGAGRSAKLFGDALTDVCESLAFQIAADGEGATKVIHILVDKARSDMDAKVIARAIANSMLVKCAMHGNDPNWGRIVSAAGMCGAAFEPQKAQLKLCAAPVFKNGTPLAFNSHLVSEAMRSPEVHIHLTCNLGRSSAVCWTCDLSREYVTINADYHT